MKEVLQFLFTALLAFASADYTLGRAQVSDPIRVVVAALFAVVLTLLVGALGLARVFN